MAESLQEFTRFTWWITEQRQAAVDLYIIKEHNYCLTQCNDSHVCLSVCPSITLVILLTVTLLLQTTNCKLYMLYWLAPLLFNVYKTVSIILHLSLINCPLLEIHMQSLRPQMPICNDILHDFSACSCSIHRHVVVLICCISHELLIHNGG